MIDAYIRKMRFVPSVIILVIDLCIVFCATMLAIFFRGSVIKTTHLSTIFTPVIPIAILGVRTIFSFFLISIKLLYVIQILKIS
jgi:hypothetical protein